MTIAAYIILPLLIWLVLQWISWSGTTTGSDHFFHVRLIDAIKNTRNRFVVKSPIFWNEKHFAYPQLFHWTLSFFPERLYRENYKYVGVVSKIAEVTAFNCFLIFLRGWLRFDDIIFLYANLIIHVYPSGYAIWNARNTGLSPRGIALVAGQIYTYLVFAYALDSQPLLLGCVLLTIVVILLLSQMTLQYVVLTLPLMAAAFKAPELIPLPFIAFGIFYLLIPQVAVNYITGQYNHKRNYFLFLSEIFILVERPSIYRDFIHDFWIRLRKDGNIFRAVYYMTKNPIMEVLYGMPFLWLALIGYYFFNGVSQHRPIQLLVVLIWIALAVFLLTSFRVTRFLGEPQRYVEFVLPVATVLFSLIYPPAFILGIVSVCCVMIATYQWAYRSTNVIQEKNKLFRKMLDCVSNPGDTDVCILSNDNELLRFLPASGYKVIEPILTDYYETKEAFQRQFHQDDHNIISPCFLKTAFTMHDHPILILNKSMYGIDLLQKEFPLFAKQLKKTDTLEAYEVYRRI